MQSCFRNFRISSSVPQGFPPWRYGSRGNALLLDKKDANNPISHPISVDEFESKAFEALEHSMISKNTLLSMETYNMTKEGNRPLPVAGLVLLDDMNQFLRAHNRSTADFIPNKKDNFYDSKKWLNFGVAVSGGSDSICLLYLMDQFLKKHDPWFKNTLGYKPILTAIHVDHKIREESSKEAKEIQTNILHSGIHCQITSLNWKKDENKGKQSVLRDKRYKALEDICISKNINFLLLGHNLDDQIESFVMRMQKSSTMKGLEGMKMSRELSPMLYIYRPLLSFTKERINATCVENHWPWKEDPSNQDCKYTRNSLRKEIISERDISKKELLELFQSSGRVNCLREKQEHDLMRACMMFYWEFGAFKLVRSKFDLFKKWPWLQLHALKQAVCLIARNPSRVKLKNCEDLLSFVNQKHAGGQRFSIGGCVVYPSADELFFIHSTEDVPRIPLHKSGLTYFDNKWLIKHDHCGTQNELFVQYLTPPMCNKNSPAWRKINTSFQFLPTFIRRTLIVILDSDKRVITVPQLDLHTITRVESFFVIHGLGNTELSQ